MTIRSFGKKTVPDPNRYCFPRMAIRESAPTGGSDYLYLYDAIEDQQSLGACVAFGTGGMVEAFAYKRGGTRISTSKAAIFSDAKYNYEPDDIQDDGLQVTDGLRVLESIGYIPDAEYPYENSDQQILAPVPSNLVHDKDWLVHSFAAVPHSVDGLRVALYKHGPIVIGINFPESWITPGPDGMLSADVGTIAGGHCMNIVTDGGAKTGEKPGYFRLRNSWGTSWGLGGYAWVPFETLIKVLTDAYTIALP
jgi:hypothetical protein